jgi:hypothetical protein
MSNQPLKPKFPVYETGNPANKSFFNLAPSVAQNPNDINTPSYDYYLNVKIRLLECKIAACIFFYPGETIAKMKELNTFPESDHRALHFWKKVQENLPAILRGGYEQAYPILTRCLYDPIDLRIWEGEFYTLDLPEVYDNHLTDMPGFIQTLKEKRVLLKLYRKDQAEGGYEKLTEGYL